MKRTVATIACMFLAVSASTLLAAPSDARLWTPEGGQQQVVVADLDLTNLAQQLLDRGDYQSAANMYASIASLSEAPGEKLFALVRQADALVMAEEYSDALDRYNTLAEQYPGTLPYQHVAHNMRIIADAYAAGEARFLGFTDRGKAREIYNFLLDIAPAGATTASDRLRLARLQQEDGDVDMALETYQTIAQRHAGTAEAKEARLERIELLIDKSNERIAADDLVRRARREADFFITDYAGTKEEEIARQLKRRGEEVLAGHLLYLGRFYLRNAHYRPQASERYLNELLSTYPDTSAADEARTVLAEVQQIQQEEADQDEQQAALAPPTDEKHVRRPPRSPDTETVSTVEEHSPADDVRQPGTVEELKKRDAVGKWLLPLPELGLKDDEQE